jgi:hypothetical protein
MVSKYRIRIEDVLNGRIALLVPGAKGERDLVEDLVTSIVAKGVGVFKTQAQVEAAIRAGVAETLLSLKTEVRP